MPYIVIRLNNRSREFVSTVQLGDDYTMEQAREIASSLNAALYEAWMSEHCEAMSAKAEE
jgi:hypothetical protein